jgi:DNA-binding transcriptional regulator YdaS (Cro superfamily)
LPKIRNQGIYGRPQFNQASKIVARFGGESKLAALIGVSRISVYRWQYSRPVGTGGLIPTAQIDKIRAVARVQGILLRPEDWVPEVVKYDEDSQPITKVKRSPKSIADLLA